MSVTREFYQACADECAAEAAAATLPNVRERALRSEAAWRAMAARQDRIARSRETAEAERLERRAGEVAAASQAALDGAGESA